MQRQCYALGLIPEIPDLLKMQFWYVYHESPQGFYDALTFVADQKYIDSFVFMLLVAVSLNWISRFFKGLSPFQKVFMNNFAKCLVASTLLDVLLPH